MILRGNNYIASCSYAFTYVDLSHDERKKTKLFHIQVVSHHTKIGTLVYSRSQVNLISKDIVEKLGLETKPLPKTFPLGWVHENARLHVSKHCKLRFFAISNKFMDEVELNLIPLDICRIVLGIPYLYDKKVVFYMEHNRYHLFKDGIEFIIRAQNMKHDLYVVATGKNKMLINVTHKVQHEELQHEGIVDDKSEPTEKGKLHIGLFSYTSAFLVL